ncbi:hypothetical protein R1T08_02360 [Streptomyces sp. SBC-4]|nr:hypothetical protein [Streptomyces sp. SBC-4]MDV5143180.1 hypothetical protein [Streptomyces sp. SBC-4]
MHPAQPGGPGPSADKAVLDLVSPDRLNPYLKQCSGDLHAALALYRWNSEISAAFFESLGHLEVMLRNALDARLVARQLRRGLSDEWFIDAAVPLSAEARDDIAKAQGRAARGCKGPAPRGKIIAELGFGFWRFLLARQYKATLWPDLARAFPRAPKRALYVVEEPIKRLHAFRNRIAHHEGIWHLPLDKRWDDIQALLGYIEPAAADWVTDSSRIDDVLARRP